MNGEMSKAKKARVVSTSKLPDWAKEGYKPPYEMGSNLKDVTTSKKEKKQTTTGVKRPYPWSAKTVLSPKY